MSARSLIIASVLLAAPIASAHPNVTSGPAFANKGGQIITIGLSHGCDGLDTQSIQVHIPAGITSIRALPADGFGKPTFTKSGTNVSSITWTKVSDADLQPDDPQFYEFKFRARVGDVAFTQVLFNVTQVCRNPADAPGIVTTVLWDQPPGSTTGEPAAPLNVLPARVTGWNKFTVPAAIPEADYGLWFADAQIVWAGTRAFSPNPITLGQIGATAGVSVLGGEIAAGTELLVKY
jgi:uncharacterized protein YcnI